MTNQMLVFGGNHNGIIGLKKVQYEKFGTLYSYPIEAFNAVYQELTIK